MMGSSLINFLDTVFGGYFFFFFWGGGVVFNDGGWAPWISMIFFWGQGGMRGHFRKNRG